MEEEDDLIMEQNVGENKRKFDIVPEDTMVKECEEIFMISDKNVCTCPLF